MNIGGKSLKDISLKTKIGGILISFAVIAVINYSSIKYFQSNQVNDAAVVDVAGRQRMLSQRIAFFAEMISCGKVQTKEDLSEVLHLYQTSLDALKFGGSAPQMNSDIVLPPTNPGLMALFLPAEVLWEEYKENAEFILSAPLYIDSIQTKIVVDSLGNRTRQKEQVEMMNPKVAASINFIETNATELLHRNNLLVKGYVNNCLAKQQKLHYLLWFLLALNAVMILIGFHIIDNYIVKPTKLIGDGARHLAQGNLTDKIAYKSKDEIGHAVDNLNNMSENLKQAARFAQAIGEGDYDAKFEAVSEQDRLGTSLIEMRDQLIEVAHKDQNRNWVNEGLAQAGDLLRANQSNLQNLAGSTINFLVKYTGANQGAMFIVNDDDEEDTYLEMVGMYAWGRQKYITKKVIYGEGMVGTVWQEKELIYLTDIPDDYVHISSGLGNANPKSIVVVPLKFNEDIMGVMEIASFKEYDSHQIEFIQKLSENVASTISTAKINHKTKFLLQQTQEQTEEMRAQEEEMRQNMEELSATQEEMLRKEQEYIEVIKNLEAQLETKPVEEES